MLAAAAVATYTALSVIILSAGVGSCRPAFGRGWDRAKELWRVVVTLAGLLVLTDTGLLLARQNLPPWQSGVYAVASLFATALLLGLQFIPVLFFPCLAQRFNRRRLLALSSAWTTLLGLGTVAVVSVVASPLIVAAVGRAYQDGASVAPLFTLLGTMWALIQLLLYSGLAVRDRSVTLPLWSCVGLEGALIIGLLHGRMQAVLLASLVSATVLQAALTVREVVSLRRRSPTAEVVPSSVVVPPLRREALPATTTALTFRIGEVL